MPTLRQLDEAAPDRLIASVLTLMGGRIVHADGPCSKLAPLLPPARPDWSPVNAFGGYHQGRQKVGGARSAGPTWSALACDCWMTWAPDGTARPRRGVPAPGPSCPRAAARRACIRRLSRGSSRWRGWPTNRRHPQARVNRCAQPDRDKYLWPTTAPWGRVRLEPHPDATRRVAAVAALRARSPRLRSRPWHSRWLVSPPVSVSQRGIERDAQFHGSRIPLQCTCTDPERVSSVLGSVRDTGVVAHATLSHRHPAISTRPVPGDVSTDSACMARGVWSDDLVSWACHHRRASTSSGFTGFAWCPQLVRS